MSYREHSQCADLEDADAVVPELEQLRDQLVEALLRVEWEWWHDGRHGVLQDAEHSPYRMQEFQGPWCPCCEAEVGNSKPQDQKHARDCALDAALTAAGLPDQTSRDAARKAIAERKP
jgi:hypothetical protein